MLQRKRTKKYEETKRRQKKKKKDNEHSASVFQHRTLHLTQAWEGKDKWKGRERRNARCCTGSMWCSYPR